MGGRLSVSRSHASGEVVWWFFFLRGLVGGGGDVVICFICGPVSG